MIVRISSEDVFEIDDAQHGKLNELDDAVVAKVDAGDEAGYKTTFDALLSFVRSEGTVLPDDDLRASDHILPPADLSFEEAGQNFTGDGLIPDPPPAA
jgi:hypothetical protein